MLRQGTRAAVLAAALIAPAGAVAADQGSCAWDVRSDPDQVNVAYPDESATYWATQWAAAPGTELRITGTYPHARYFSFHVYEGGVPIDHAYDAQVVPESGANPFLKGADRRSPGRYALRVVSGAPPEQREPNTLYTGRGVVAGEPVPVVTIIYRVYLGEGDLAGAVGLPGVQIKAGDGSVSRPPLCEESTQAGEGGFNAAIKDASLPASWPSPTGEAPAWTVARSGGATNPFFPNFDVTYLALAVRRDAGDVIAFRVKAPTFVRTAGRARFGGGQLRYWSICVNEQATTRYVDCLPDQEARLDRRGWLHVVISDAAHKPARLGPFDNWLPAGPYPDAFVLFRHMLPDPGFAFAAQRIPADSTPAAYLGAYHPQTEVCSAAQFDADRCGLPQAVTKAKAQTRKKPKKKPRKRKPPRRRS